MSTTLNSLARLALAGAIYDTYESNYDRPKDNPDVDILMHELKSEVEHAFKLWDRITARGISRIEKKIEAAKEKTMLSKPRSIITFIDFAVAILDEPARKCNGDRKMAVIKIIDLLLRLRMAIGGKNEYTLSSIAAVKAADIWDGIEI
jgi:hypothetical protein